MLKDKLDAVTPLFTERTLMMLRRRVINPFISTAVNAGTSWKGTRERHPNNWNPWICSNALWVTAVVEDDLAVRETAVTRALEYLDNFIGGYAPDGGCDEGPGYWGRAGASLFEFLYLLKCSTNGALDLFGDEKICMIADYLKKVQLYGFVFQLSQA